MAFVLIQNYVIAKIMSFNQNVSIHKWDYRYNLHGIDTFWVLPKDIYTIFNVSIHLDKIA